MNYEALKDEIKEIATIADGVPDAFKVRCFEMLLDSLLKRDDTVPPSAPAAAPSLPAAPPPPAQPPAPPAGDIPTPTQLRLLMQRTGLSMDELKRVVFVADGDVLFIKEPTGRKITEGQIDWALLLALKNCILNNSLTVDPEAVRSVCQEKGYYDRPNFSSTFKRTQYAKLFKGLMEPQGAPQALTNDGQAELATLIQQLAAQQ